MPGKNNKLVWMLEQWEKLHWLLPFMLLFTLISNAAAIAYPLVFRKLMDLLANILSNPSGYPQPMQQVNRLLLLFLAIGGGQLVAGFYPLLRGSINNLFEHRLRMKYFQHLEHKDYAFFQHFRTGDVVTRLNDTNSSFILCSGIFRTLDSVLIVLFGIIVMFTVNVRLSLLSLVPVPFILVVIYFTIGKLVAGSRKNLEAISSVNNQLEMSFSGIRIIKSFVSEAKYNRFFDTTLDNRIKTELRLIRLHSVQHLLFQYMDYFAQIGVILFGGWLAVKGEISIGTFFLFYTYLSIMVEPMFAIPMVFVIIKQAMVSINRLEEMKDFPLQYPASKGIRDFDNLQSIRFDQVSFRYPEKEKAVLSDCTFSLKRGEKLLIMGSTGSGKTTLANLLTGILQPERGKIYLNEISLEELDLDAWRGKIGCVPQEALLFGGSIKDNIRFANDLSNDGDYDSAVQIAQLKAELEAFPQKEQTVVGTRGQTVSGGQKQRITIARALITKPQCLVLDDITASLDADNEEKLWQEITQNFPDITCLVISQRLSTLNYVDKVLFIDGSGFCHTGTHQELLALTAYQEFIRKGV